MFRLKSLACSVLTTVLIAGCGGEPSDQPELHPVSGKVSQGGKPVSNMSITFTPVAGGRPASGTLADDGSFSLAYTADAKGAPVGMHAVRLGFIHPATEDYEAGSEKKKEKEKEQPGKDALKGLPKSAFDGTLQKEVKPGDNEINLEL